MLRDSWDVIEDSQKALNKCDVELFSEVLDESKRVSPVGTLSLIETSLLQLYPKFDLNHEPPRGPAVQMFIKAAKVLEELAPILIYSEHSREGVKNAIIVAQMIAKHSDLVGNEYLERAMNTVMTLTTAEAMLNAAKAGVPGVVERLKLESLGPRAPV